MVGRTYCIVGMIGLIASLGSLRAADAEGTLRVEGYSEPSKLIPIAIEGLSGEALSVLTFDLEIAGFTIVPVDRAPYVASGTRGSSLVGRLTDRAAQAVKVSKEYSGGSVRAQAHAFADDVVEQFPNRRGIARTRILFRMEANKNSEIYLADYDGYNAMAVTRDNTISRDPAWMPGHGAIYYTSYRTGNPFVYRQELRTGERRIIAGYAGLNAAPAISPDGRRLALILSKSGSPDLFVANSDGTNLKQLTQTREDESSPCWSPDGRDLCVVSRVSGRAALYLISASGGGALRRLRTEGAINATEPSWSPDGTAIAFTASMGGFQICVVPAAGGEAEVLVGGEDPSWAPDSRRLIFTRRVGGGRVLSLLDVPTKRVKDIRRLSGSCSQADWSK